LTAPALQQTINPLESDKIMKITIAEYNEDWAQLFHAEQALLGVALGKGAVAIEHIGSTSVKGLAAKPIIDIMIGLADFAMADFVVPKIVALGYDYIAKYNAIMPYRRFFVRETEQVRTHQIHMVEIHSEFWNRHLLFRDYLRTNTEVMNEYAALKKQLAERDWNDVNEYADAKTEFIRNAEKEAERIFRINMK
jgi:GrpB-like predicted nucleotidyltransferase (UPF0157 family)